MPWWAEAIIGHRGERLGHNQYEGNIVHRLDTHSKPLGFYFDIDATWAFNKGLKTNICDAKKSVLAESCFLYTEMVQNMYHWCQMQISYCMFVLTLKFFNDYTKYFILFYFFLFFQSHHAVTVWKQWLMFWIAMYQTYLDIFTLIAHLIASNTDIQ